MSHSIRASVAALAIALAIVASSASAQPAPPVQASFETELGAVKVLSHTYRVGPLASSTNFDFVNQGGQEILFPFQRYMAAATFSGRHKLDFIYQPFELATEADFPSAVTVDTKTFIGPTKLTYSFPFYRATYQYRFLAGEAGWLAGGAAIQLRNASIRFESLPGAPSPQLAVSQNLGVVPALALSGRLNLGGTWFASFEATGIYASSALFNGANFKFEGSILDASLRAGFAFDEHHEVFANARFFGGTASGVSQYPRSTWTDSISPETENRLATVALTLGLTMR